MSNKKKIIITGVVALIALAAVVAVNKNKGENQ